MPSWQSALTYRQLPVYGELSGLKNQAWSKAMQHNLSLIHISEPTRQEAISYAVFCLKKIGLSISALVFVQLTINSTENAAKFEQAVKSIRRVQECSVLTGTYDYLLQVVALDLADYEKLIKGELANIPNIKNLESTIVLNQLDVNFSPPFAEN